MNFAKRLKKVREERYLSQTEFAKIVNLAPSAISQFESNLRQPSAPALIKICKGLDISADYLLGLRGDN